jgi:hypothetical protein
VSDREGRPITAVRPAVVDVDTGEFMRYGDRLVSRQQRELVAAIRGSAYLVERDFDRWPYSMLISVPLITGQRRWFLATTIQPDRDAAARLLRCHRFLFAGDEAWADLAEWTMLGFTPQEVADWAKAGFPQMWQARALSDLGFTPASAKAAAGDGLRQQRPWLQGWFRQAIQPYFDDPDLDVLARELHDVLERIDLRLPWPTHFEGSSFDAATLLVLRLHSRDRELARLTAQTLVSLLWAPPASQNLRFPVPGWWWRTQLGRACAAALGRSSWPPGDPDALTVGEAMELLEVSRPVVYHLLAVNAVVRLDGGYLSRGSLLRHRGSAFPLGRG